LPDEHPKSQVLYIHCAACAAELPSGQSIREFARLNVGIEEGEIFVVCERHGIQITSLPLDPEHFRESPRCECDACKSRQNIGDKS